MLRFTFHDTSRVIVRAMCPTHSRYNPATDGGGGIFGGCSTCQQIFSVWMAKQKAESAIRDLRVLAEPWTPTKRATSPSHRRPNPTSTPVSAPTPSFSAINLGKSGVAVKAPSKRLALLAVCLLAIPFAAGAQSTCPIEVVAVNPRAVSVINGGPALLVSYRNTTSTTITGIVFDARFGSRLRPVALSMRHPVGSGKTDAAQWGDSVWLSVLPASGQVIVWPDTVFFADGSEWSDNGMLQCAYRGDNTESVPIGIDQRSAIPVARHTLLAAGQLGEAPGNPSSADIVLGGTSASAEQKKALSREGKASLCTVRTCPPGASIVVDGKKVGEAPLSFVLLKTDAPRDIHVYLSGYKLVHRAIVPDGATIPIVATLESPGFNK